MIGWNRGPVPADLPSERCDLDDLLRSADIVSLHLGLNDQTRGLIDRRWLALMKRGAIFVSAARGALVDQAALVELLREEHIAATGLDVIAFGPPAHAPRQCGAERACSVDEPGSRAAPVYLGLRALREELAKLGA